MCRRLGKWYKANLVCAVRVRGCDRYMLELKHALDAKGHGLLEMPTGMPYRCGGVWAFPAPLWLCVFAWTDVRGVSTVR